MRKVNPVKAAMVAVLYIGAGSVRAAGASLDLADLSLEELAEIRVTTVSRVEESLHDAAASVFVITGDEIRRSGVTSIPEALRLAPGVEVARRNANAWSVAIRGFNSDLSNKLLVLIDGRSVYSPLYAGVFWDVQDTLLEDIDRIEVTSGPGGTLWGANAVNGVINIITKSANDTQSGFAEIGGGNEERGTVAMRFGGALAENVSARTYFKVLDRDSTQRFSGGDGIDGLRIARSGFRMDWTRDSSNEMTFQGDVYSGEKDGEFLDDFSLGTLPAGTIQGETDLAGANILGRWNRRINDSSDTSLQIYYDYTRRDIPNAYGEKRDTVDIDFQHHLLVGNRHELVWGGGFRRTGDELINSEFASFEPEARTDRTWSAFIQDEIELRRDSLFLTVGSKFENNDYTGTETQPNVRLSWIIDQRQTFWSAVSRAVRIPSRLDTDLQLTVPVSIPTIAFPVYVRVNGDAGFISERLLSREAGYRARIGTRFSVDLALFHNSYDGIQTTEPGEPVLVLTPPGPYAVLPNSLENGMEGTSEGGSVALMWQPADRFFTRFQYTRLDMQLQNMPGSEGSATSGAVGNSPKHQLGIRSYLDLPHDLSLYAGIRYVDDLPAQQIDDYTAVDVSLQWSASETFLMSLTLRNVNDRRHREFGSGSGNVLERDARLRVNWSF